MRVLRFLLVLICLASAAQLASADRAAAEFYSRRGDQSAQAKDWATAQGHYRKALEEDATYLPARAGLAEALWSAGDRRTAIEELRRFAAEADAPGATPAAWSALVTRTRKRLAELDASGAQLEQIAEKYVADLLVVGDRWATKDPAVASAAYREVARLRPKHARALQGLEKIAKADLASRITLFSGKDRKGWIRLEDKRWSLADGVLTGDAPGLALVVRTEVDFRGDFDVRMEARLVEALGDKWMLALLGAMKGDYRHSTFGVTKGHVVWCEERAAGDVETLLDLSPGSLSPPLDPKEWAWYEMRFRGDQAQAFVNGQLVGTFPRGKDRDEGGVGIRVQEARVSIRRVDIRQR